MEDFFLQLSYSPWLIAGCLALGALYAWILYSKQLHWSARANRLLAVLRFATVSLLAFILLNPIVKQRFSQIEKPNLIIALDNSTSVKEFSDSAMLSARLASLNKLQSNLSEDFDVSVRSLNRKDLEQAGQARFDQSSTDLSELLEGIRTDFEGSNVASVVLLADGIYNQGFSPAFFSAAFPVHIIPVGDTLSRSDLSIYSLEYNQVSHKGSRFPIKAAVHYTKPKQNFATVRLLEGGKVLETRRVPLRGSQGVQELTFQLDGNEVGMKRYTVQVDAHEGEFLVENNRKDALIDIIDGKQKVMILAAAPHPDINAVCSALSNTENYEIELWLASDAEGKAPKAEDADVLVFFQIPSLDRSVNMLSNELLKSQLPKLFLTGEQSNYALLSRTVSFLDIRNRITQKDLVKASFNTGFKDFNYTRNFQEVLNQLPPLEVPFASVNMKKGAKVLAYQQVGRVTTNKPLVALQDQQEPKTGVLIGEGLWRWRIHENFFHSGAKATQELFTKLIHFLSSRKDRRQFKVVARERSVPFPKSVRLRTELYNELFEPVYGQKVTLDLVNEVDSAFRYSIVTSPQNADFVLNGLEPGIYRYSARVQWNERNFSARGQFSVERQNLEAKQMRADLSLLQKLSNNSNGRLLTETEQIEGLKPERTQGIIYTKESFLPLVHLKFLFFVFVFLLSIEWFFRKYLGSY